MTNLTSRLFLLPFAADHDVEFEPLRRITGCALASLILYRGGNRQRQLGFRVQIEEGGDLEIAVIYREWFLDSLHFF